MKARFLSLFLLLIIIPIVGSSEPHQPVIQKSPLDNREYATTVLENGLRVVVVSDQEAPTAGAALVVNAGLYDDPKAYPGLAHFLEHMLFLGTKKFPVPDEFQNFIQAHGGNRNAMTQGDATTFFFSIQPDAFGPALVRFADFFVSPAFYPEYVDRELNAVDQEFYLYLHKDNWAAMEVNKETSNPEHPYFHHFGGNMQTLGYDKVNLHKQLRAFFQKHYHAKNMTLALVGPQSAQSLLYFAKQNFSAIAKAPEGYAKTLHAPLYTPEQLGVDIHMKSKGQYQELTLTFPLEHETCHIKRKSKQLVSSILGHDGKGGLSLTLKKQDWIINASAAYETFSQEQDAIVLNFSLTDEGLKHIDDITRCTFNAISMLKKKGLPHYYAKEMKTINQWYFLYLEKQDATSLAMALAGILQNTPAEAILTSSFLLPKDKISQEAIDYVLSKMTPENMRRFIISPDEVTDKQSKWYQASYRVEKISDNTMKRLMRHLYFSGLELPKPNRFLPSDLKLAQPIVQADSEPKKLRDDKVTLWHYQDSHFKKPKGSIFINFHVPWVAESAESSLLAEIYTQMAMESLREQFYAASLAGAGISFTEHSRGLTLAITGYSDKQDKLLAEILISIRKFKVDSTNFEAIKETMSRQIKNFDQRTLLEKGHVELNTLLLSPSWHPSELYTVCQELTAEKLEQFKQAFWKSNHIEMMVHGNYTAAQAQEFALIAENSMPSLAKKGSSHGMVKMAELAKGAKHYRQIPASDGNHIAIWYHQNQAKDYETLAKTLMLTELIEVPYYQALRVEKQLGYSLGTQPFNFRKISGILFYIQSTKADPNGLLTEIKRFLANYRHTLHSLKDEEFESTREELTYKLLQPPQTLDEQAGQWWSSIENGEADFNHNQKIANALATINKKEFLRFSSALLDDSAQQGQLFVLSAPPIVRENETEILSVKEFREHAPFIS